MPKIKHDVQVWPAGKDNKRWRAMCTCGWKGKLHNVRLPAAREARQHTLETK